MGDNCEFGGGRVKVHRPHAGSGERKPNRAVAGGREHQGANQTRESERPPATAGPKGGGHSSGGAGGWGLFAGDGEAKRRRRVAGYKAYAVEGKVKASVRQGIRWIKGKCSGVVHGW